ncbi:hypothetical protein IH979_02210 [Patescibacteria group bacterium]|nr:hypothetical protein [Patescibacteria group bacterium]
MAENVMDSRSRLSKGFKAQIRGFLKALVEKCGQKIRSVHWGWLITGLIVWILVEVVVNVALHFLGHVVFPVLGPFLLDSVMLYFDEIIVASVPIICGKELLRRFWVSYIEEEPLQLESDE